MKLKAIFYSSNDGIKLAFDGLDLTRTWLVLFDQKLF